MRSERHYWLMKSEPETYGIDHLRQDKKTAWTGVRNFQARNYMREMRIGDEVLYYHSNCKIPGIYGLAKVASLPYPDSTQFDPTSDYYDRRATKDKPIWDLVDVVFVQKFKAPLSLDDIRRDHALKSMMILAKGSRLSVTPVTAEHFERILKTFA